MLVLLVILTAGGIALGDTSWPVHYNGSKAKCLESETPEGFLYESASFAIHCSERISIGRANEMATVAESVRGVLLQLPLPLVSSPNTKTGASAKGRRSGIRIYPTHEAYTSAGGPAGSVGYYHARRDEVIVSQPYLVEPKRFRSNLQPRQRYRLLVHELVHQAMAQRSALLPLWFSEGIAEYLSAAQIAPGRYRFDSMHHDVISHFRAVWLHDRRNAITVPPVGKLIQMSPAAWSHDNRTSGANAYAKYAGSLLLTHYYLELAKRDLGGLREFLVQAEKAEVHLRNGRRWHQRGQHTPIPNPKQLLEGRPADLIEKQLTAWWMRKGLQLQFVIPSPERTTKGKSPPLEEWE